MKTGEIYAEIWNSWTKFMRKGCQNILLITPCVSDKMHNDKF